MKNLNKKPPEGWATTYQADLRSWANARGISLNEMIQEGEAFTLEMARREIGPHVVACRFDWNRGVFKIYVRPSFDHDRHESEAH